MGARVQYLNIHFTIRALRLQLLAAYCSSFHTEASSSACICRDRRNLARVARLSLGQYTKQRNAPGPGFVIGYGSSVDENKQHTSTEAQCCSFGG